MLMTVLEATAKAWTTPNDESDPANAPIPEIWTPAHVARRMIEAFEIDGRAARIERPKKPGSAHPAVEADEPERDETGALVIDQEALAMALERYRDAKNTAAPSPDEIIAMETAFMWLLMLLDSEPDARIALKVWAGCKASGRSISKYCRENGVSKMTFLGRKDRALKAVSSKLNVNSEPVW